MVLESVRYPGQHVGVRESGEIKKPSHTGKGTHAQFTPIVIGIYIAPIIIELIILICFSVFVIRWR